jgi:HK97 family phage major capsid protein/HK97 family phage prohead protease
MTEVLHKSLASPAGSDPLAYVMSDESVDRMGDVIEAKGWRLNHFKRNPIALFNHKSDFPIGHWTDVKVDGDRLVGKLNLLPAGVSERLDEIRAAVEAGVLRAVSVGFSATKAEPLNNGGVRFKETELVECSLVSVPANPNALQLAKSLNLSDDVQEVIFGKSADEIAALRRTGEPATPPAPHTRASVPAVPRIMKMATLAERIEGAQNELVSLKDKLTDHTRGDDIDQTVIEELSSGIEQKEAQLSSLKRAEVALAAKTVDAPEAKSIELRRPAAAPAQKIAPGDYMLRSAVVKLLSHVTKQDPMQILHKAYGDDEATKVVFDQVTKAASAPATTTTSGWASQLVQTVNADFMETLTAAAVYPSLSARGLRLNFGRNGVISIPSRSATPTIAGSFVAEGAPIPVRQGAFTSQSLTPKKLAVISTFTREIAQHSVPAIEGLIRDAIREDTSVALDTVLLDATAASTTRPAGLRNGVTVTTATAGGGIAALVADAKNLVGALITATNGNVRAPVWIMNPAQALAISLTSNAGGDFVFADAMNGGNFLGYPVIQSPTVPAGMLILVDAADFVSVTGDEPMFDVSDQATLHMEDTTPLAISATGTPNTVAAPVRSLWQTDSIALRMIMPMNWTLRRTGVLSWTQAVTW